MLIMFILFSCYDLASLGQLAGDLKIEVAIVQIIMFRPKPAQFERTKSAANSLVFDNSLFTGGLSKYYRAEKLVKTTALARDCDNRTTLVKQKFQPNSFSMYVM